MCSKFMLFFNIVDNIRHCIGLYNRGGGAGQERRVCFLSAAAYRSDPLLDSVSVKTEAKLEPVRRRVASTECRGCKNNE